MGTETRTETAERIRSRVEEITGRKTELVTDTGNNGGRRCLIRFRQRTETGRVRVVPSVAATPLVNEVADGEMSADRAAEIIAERLANAETAQDGEITEMAGKMADPAFVLENVRCRLVNREMNRDVLEGLVHRPYLDLAVIYAVVMMERDGDEYAVRLSERLMERTGLDFDEVDEAARRNTRGRGFRTADMAEYMRDNGIPDAEETGLTVVTNTNMTFGAAALLFPETFREAADRAGGDLYVLPSSVHELIALPVSRGIGVGELRQMVGKINHDEVDDDEVLGTSVYLYDRRRGCIRIAEEKKGGKG